MIKRISCAISLSVIIMSGCYGQNISGGSIRENAGENVLVNFTEVEDADGKTYIYNSNAQLKSDYWELYKKSGAQSVAEFVSLLLNAKPDFDEGKIVTKVGEIKLSNEERVRMLVYTYIHAAPGLEISNDENGLFQKVMNSILTMEPNEQRFTIGATCDVIDNANLEKMKEYAKDLLVYFEEESVPDAKTVEKVNKTVSNAKGSEPWVKDIELIKFRMGFEDGKVKIKINSEEKNLNIHELCKSINNVLPEEIHAMLKNYFRDIKPLPLLEHNKFQRPNDALFLYYMLNRFGIKSSIKYKSNGPEYYVGEPNDAMQYFLKNKSAMYLLQSCFINLGFPREEFSRLIEKCKSKI